MEIANFSIALPDEGDPIIDQMIADGFNVIINNNGALNPMLTEKAAANPNVTIVCLENEFNPNGVSNILSATIRAEESAFLAGYVAAKKSETHTVGFFAAQRTFRHCLLKRALQPAQRMPMNKLAIQL